MFSETSGRLNRSRPPRTGQIMNFMISARLAIAHGHPFGSVFMSVRRVVMMVVAATVALSWTSSALASCGDYLFRSGIPVSGSHSTSMDSVFDVSGQVGASNNLPVQIPGRRCSGPNCSSQPLPLPPVDSAPSQLIRTFDQAALLELLVDVLPTSRGIEIPESEFGACFAPASIFRPPAAQA